MTKSFRPYSLDQQLLLPPDMRSWLPEGDVALFVSDVVDQWDLSAISAADESGEGRGPPPDHPARMVKVLLYGYGIGLTSSRKLERATYRAGALRVLAGDPHPDHDSIAEFRRRHLDALAALVAQGLRRCQAAGLVKRGHVALDGTKLKANASKPKAMSYARMEETEGRLEGEVRALLAEAEEVDAAEAAQDGPGRRGEELPAELARRERRLLKIRAAKAALQAEAQARAAEAAEAARAKRAAREQREGSAKGKPATIPDPEQAQPAPTAERNFTDPESRIMVAGATKEFVQGYKAQAAVDSQAQVIGACDVTQAAGDVGQFVPLLDQTIANMGQRPQQVTADAGYFSEANLTAPQFIGIEFYVPPDRPSHSGAPVAGRRRQGPFSEAMRSKLQTVGGRFTPGAKPSRSPCSARSNRRAGFADSGCGASRRSAGSGPSSASPPTCSSFSRAQSCPTPA